MILLVTLIITLFIFFFGFFGLEDFVPVILIFYIYVFYERKISKIFLLNIFILFFFSLFYFLNSYYLGQEDLYAIIGKFAYPSIFLLLGYYSSLKEEINEEYVFFYSALGLLLFSILSYFYSTIVFGSYANVLERGGGRILYSFWDNSPYAATLINGYLAIFISLLFYYIINFNNDRFFYIKTILSCSALYIGFSLGNRTALLIASISFLTFIIFSVKEKIKIRWNVLILLIVSSSVFLLKNFSESLFSNRVEDLSATDDPRMRAWSEGISIISNNFLGSIDKTSVGFAHNLWIDVGIGGGIVPFLLLIMFSLINFLMIIFLVIYKEKSKIDYLLIYSFIAFFITFMLEPIFQGLFKLFCLYCLFVGILVHNFEKKVSI